MKNLLNQYICKILKNDSFQFMEVCTYKVTGTDYLHYFHNQTTNLITTLNDKSFVINSVLDLKAKVVAPFLFCKNSEKESYIIFHKDYEEDLLERLNKYIISEDVELEKIDCNPVFSFLNGEFNGSLFNTNLYISFNSNLKEIDKDLNVYTTLLTSQGIDLKFNNAKDNLFNTTILEQVAFDKKKGCFLGQEIVSKIAVNRGGSFYPVLAESLKDQLYEEKIILNDKKIGTVNMRGDNFYNISLLRDYRINESIISLEKDNLKVYTYPLFKNSKELAALIYNEALSLFHNEKLDLACDYLKLCLKIDSDMEDACEVLGVIYGRLQKYDEAIAVMQNLSKINPKSVMAHTNMSLFYMRLGKIDEAEVEKSNATIKSFERYGDEAQSKRAQEEKKKQEVYELERKLEMFKQVLEIDPDDTLANFGLGQAYLLREDFKGAKEKLSLVIKNDPKYSVAYLNLSKALLALKEKVQAREILEKGISVAAKNGDLMPANEMQSLLNKL